MEYMKIILIFLLITTLYILIQVTQQTQGKDKVVYVSQPTMPTIPVWGQGPVWRGPIPGGRPWGRRRRGWRRRFWL